MALTLSWVFGWKMYLFIQLPITIVAGAIGIWMFYVQHQFEGAYWERGDAWDYTVAALQGSSLPSAQDSPVVLGQYRLSPHPSPQPPHPQL